MTRGRNYFVLSDSEKNLFTYSSTQPCVFISHKKEDTDFARHLSDYVMDKGKNDRGTGSSSPVTSPGSCILNTLN